MSATDSPQPPPESPSDPLAKKQKKPPACDSCKARRVLCHPTTDGTPCPRCLEKGIQCITTPVVRGRPPRKYLGLGLTPPSTSPSLSSVAGKPTKPPESPSSSSYEPRPPHELSPELVRHLLDCFTHLPQSNHPLFRDTTLSDRLAAVSWHIHLLPPQTKVLAYCVVALSAYISFDSAILGPGPHPTSFDDHAWFAPGSDLRAYGVRRAQTCRALSGLALQLATEHGVLLEPTGENALSCYLIQCLEWEKDSRSRPWAVAYLSHVRALAATWPDKTYLNLYHTARWTAYLEMEVLDATQSHKPILISQHDQLSLTGLLPPSLQNLLAAVRNMMQEQNSNKRPPHALVVFALLGPFQFHVTRMARQLYETITGDYARRHPLNEASISDFISSLSMLETIQTLVAENRELEEQLHSAQNRNNNTPAAPGEAQAGVGAGAEADSNLFVSPPQRRSVDLNLRICTYVMTLARATLTLALHNELDMRRRAAVAFTTMTTNSAPSPGATANPESPTVVFSDPTSSRIHEPGTAVRWARQAREMAGLAAADLAQVFRTLPSLPHATHLQQGTLELWVKFCLDDAAEAERTAGVDGGVVPERTAVIETFSSALKLFGYAWQIPAGLIERLDAYVEAHRPAPDRELVDEEMFDMNMFPGIMLSGRVEADGGPPRPGVNSSMHTDMNWMGMFAGPGDAGLGGGVGYGDQPPEYGPGQVYGETSAVGVPVGIFGRVPVIPLPSRQQHQHRQQQHQSQEWYGGDRETWFGTSQSGGVQRT